MGEIFYSPVSGLTIYQAIERAVDLSKTQHKPVIAIINDIEIRIDDKTNITETVKLYHNLLNQKYSKIIQKVK